MKKESKKTWGIFPYVCVATTVLFTARIITEGYVPLWLVWLPVIVYAGVMALLLLLLWFCGYMSRRAHRRRMARHKRDFVKQVAELLKTDTDGKSKNL